MESKVVQLKRVLAHDTPKQPNKAIRRMLCASLIGAYTSCRRAARATAEPRTMIRVDDGHQSVIETSTGRTFHIVRQAHQDASATTQPDRAALPVRDRAAEQTGRPSVLGSVVALGRLGAAPIASP